MVGIGTCTVPAGFGEHTVVSLAVASPVSAARTGSDRVHARVHQHVELSHARRVALPRSPPAFSTTRVFNSPNLKTLRLVQCSSSSAALPQMGDVPDDHLPRRIDFFGILRELASSAYCCSNLVSLVAQIVPGGVVEGLDVEQLMECFSTVVVERILEPPRMCFLAMLRGGRRGGGSCAWTRPLC